MSWESSSIDLERIDRAAAHAARSTLLPQVGEWEAGGGGLAGHWPLRATSWYHRDISRNTVGGESTCEETEAEHTLFALTGSGELVVASKLEFELEYYAPGHFNRTEDPPKYSLRKMTESDILELDRETRYQEWGSPDHRSWGVRTEVDPVTGHKGEGLLLLLAGLLPEPQTEQDAASIRARRQVHELHRSTYSGWQRAQQRRVEAAEARERQLLREQMERPYREAVQRLSKREKALYDRTGSLLAVERARLKDKRIFRTIAAVCVGVALIVTIGSAVQPGVSIGYALLGGLGGGVVALIAVILVASILDELLPGPPRTGTRVDHTADVDQWLELHARTRS